MLDVTSVMIRFIILRFYKNVNLYIIKHDISSNWWSNPKKDDFLEQGFVDSLDRC